MATLFAAGRIPARKQATEQRTYAITATFLVNGDDYGGRMRCVPFRRCGDDRAGGVLGHNRKLRAGLFPPATVAGIRIERGSRQQPSQPGGMMRGTYYRVSGRRFDSFDDARLFAGIHGGDVWRFERWMSPENCGGVSESEFLFRPHYGDWIRNVRETSITTGE